MDTTPPSPRPRFLNGWRIAGWGSLIALLLIPALAMQVTSEVNWTPSDFVFAALLLGGLGGAVELTFRFARPGAAQTGYVLFGLACFFTFWINAAVGIIGDEEAVNIWFFVLTLGGILASAAVLFRPAAMRWIAALLAAGQYAVGIHALYAMPGHGVEWGLLTGFAMFWLAAGWCFHCAAAR